MLLEATRLHRRLFAIRECRRNCGSRSFSEWHRERKVFCFPLILDTLLSLSFPFHSFLANRDSRASIKSSSTSLEYIRRPRAENLGTRLPVFSWFFSFEPRNRRGRKWSPIRDGEEEKKEKKKGKRAAKKFSRLSGR